MKDLLKLLQDYREAHGHIEMMEQDGNYIFSEIYDIVNDYAAAKTFELALKRKNLDHFLVGGMDWYADITYHEGQPWGYDQEPISPYVEIGHIYNIHMEQVDAESDLWQFLADEIEQNFS